MKLILNGSAEKLLDRRKLPEAQRFVDSEVLRRCTPYVPMDTGELIRSGIRETRLGSGAVRYRTPYARKWYYTPAAFQGAPTRGNYWFERMKAAGGREAILNGAAKILGCSGKGGIGI